MTFRPAVRVEIWAVHTPLVVVPAFCLRTHTLYIPSGPQGFAPRDNFIGVRDVRRPAPTRGDRAVVKKFRDMLYDFGVAVEGGLQHPENPEFYDEWKYDTLPSLTLLVTHIQHHPSTTSMTSVFPCLILSFSSTTPRRAVFTQKGGIKETGKSAFVKAPSSSGHSTWGGQTDMAVANCCIF